MRPATQGVYAAALRFLYAVTLGRPEMSGLIPRPRVVDYLPDILSTQEIERLIGAARSPKHRAILMTSYAVGLRVSEVASLRIADIDAARKTIRIRNAKGGRDRYVPLGDRLLGVLRAYWHQARPSGEYLFQGTKRGAPISTKAIWHMVHEAARRAGLDKRISPHTMRHCYATHLLEAGTDLRTIQHLLGHRSIRSTVRYAFVTQKVLDRVPSPLDNLAGLFDSPAA